eukprot:scaffold50129_cov49-Attheya_sp.AAC.1
MDALLINALKPHYHNWASCGLFVTREDGSLIDVCVVMNDTPGTWVVLLCPILYPLSKDGFKCLYNTLNSGAHRSGFDLCVCRTRDNGTSHQIACTRYGKFRVQSSNMKGTIMNEHRLSHTIDQPFIYNDGIKSPAVRGYMNDITRKKGKTLARRNMTHRPICNDNRCTFNFLIKSNGTHWYIVKGSGNCKHSWHVKLVQHTRTTTSSLSQSEKLLITNMDGSKLSNMSIRQLLFFDKNKSLNENQIRWINKCFLKNQEQKTTESLSDADRLIDFLKKEPTISFIILYDDVGSTLIGGKPKGRPKLNEVPAKENVILSQYSSPENEKVLVGVAWVAEDEQRLFHCFPEVSFVDTTSQTNNELQPLLIMCGKDSDAKPFVTLRFIMPSEQRWTFKWFYEIAAPTLLGAKACNRNQL